MRNFSSCNHSCMQYRPTLFDAFTYQYSTAQQKANTLVGNLIIIIHVYTLEQCKNDFNWLCFLQIIKTNRNHSNSNYSSLLAIRVWYASSIIIILFVLILQEAVSMKPFLHCSSVYTCIRLPTCVFTLCFAVKYWSHECVQQSWSVLCAGVVTAAKTLYTDGRFAYVYYLFFSGPVVDVRYFLTIINDYQQLDISGHIKEKQLSQPVIFLCRSSTKPKLT